jgi:hypothetical protein
VAIGPGSPDGPPEVLLDRLKRLVKVCAVIDPRRGRPSLGGVVLPLLLVLEDIFSVKDRIC